jgi:hypothetical protein
MRRFGEAQTFVVLIWIKNKKATQAGLRTQTFVALNLNISISNLLFFVKKKISTNPTKKSYIDISHEG